MIKVNFNSDTTASVCPEILEKICAVAKEEDYMLGYNQDKYSQEVRKIMQSYFSKPIECFFNVSGSGANILSIKAMKDNYSSIICCGDTHINRYEVGGTEYNTGCKIVACHSEDAKLTIDMIKKKLTSKNNFNYAYPKIVVLSEVTELGTCYTLQELKEICEFCHKNDLYVYVDGARLANAMAFLNVGFKEILEDTGVDIASFGANKNGAMFGEMIIVLNPIFAKNFILNQKQSMQLFSKTRFLSCQFLVMLKDNIWYKNAKHANDMALYFEQELKKVGVSLAYPVQSNAVFANFSNEQIEYLKKEYKLGAYDDEKSCCRLMTSWSTSNKEINDFIEYLKKFNVKWSLFNKVMKKVDNA